MSKINLEAIHLIGIAHPGKTSNEKGQSNTDCANLWGEFEKGQFFSRIPNPLTQEVLAVYHQYEGNHMKPFSYFIGCKVAPGTAVPEGMQALTIPADTYQKIQATGQMPQCIGDAWEKIWASDIPRSFKTDFEVYDERSRDWSNATLDIFLSV